MRETAQQSLDGELQRREVNLGGSGGMLPRKIFKKLV